MTEEWRWVSGYEWRYEVSSMGRFRSHTARNGCSPGLRVFKSGYGYMMVSLSRGDGSKAVQRRLHQLVLEAFVGPRPAGHGTRHLNSDKSDNRVENLVWGTDKDNAQDTLKHGTRASGETSNFAKLTNAQVMEIRQLLCDGVGRGDIGRRYGVAAQTIGTIANGKHWKWNALRGGSSGKGDG